MFILEHYLRIEKDKSIRIRHKLSKKYKTRKEGDMYKKILQYQDEKIQIFMLYRVDSHA
jgi:hypothetical protein